MSRLVPVKAVPKVASEENMAASREVLPYQVVQPPKKEKKRRPAFWLPCRGLCEPAWSIRKMDSVP